MFWIYDVIRYIKIRLRERDRGRREIEREKREIEIERNEIR